MTKHETEQLQKIREKMAQIRKQEQAILAKDKKRQQKDRTRRLIKIGEIAEKYLGHKDITPLEFEKLAKKLSHQIHICD
ncbi:MAG: hypothetical protein LBR68_06865 [Lachnoclostridium sp.]|nr:hypothetical protein [Lachnoclostridium sp.]